MTLATALFAIGLLSTLLLAWHFALYPVAMGLLTARRTRTRPDPDEMPFVSVIVPSYNEASVIDDRAFDLTSLEYPDDRYEIVFVDSGSTDGTVDVLESALAEVDGPETHVVREAERRGKAAAIETGLSVASGDVVLVTDANTTYSDGLLTKVASHFADPEVGAVTARHEIPSAGEGLLASNQFYFDLEELKQRGETCLDSACQLYGETSAWRPEIASPELTNLAEDVELSVQIRRQGYRIVHEPEAVAYELEPSTTEEQITSKKRQLVGLIQTIFHHWRFLAVPRDAYRALIFPSRKTLQVLSPFLFVALGLSLVGLLALGAGTLFAALLLANVIGAPLVAAIVLAVQARVLGDAGGTSGALSMLPDVVKFLVLMEYTILLAWAEFLRGQYSVRWQKSRTDREVRGG